IETRDTHGAVFVGENSIVPDGSGVTVRLLPILRASLWSRGNGAMMIRTPAPDGSRLKISLILPLFDRRNAGWRPLESAVNQTIDRGQYEVIALVGPTFTDELANDAHV